MKYMSIDTIVSLLISIAFLFYIGNTEVSLSPFRIVVHKWMTAVGVALMIVGFSLIMSEVRFEGYKEGVNDTLKDVNSVIESNKLDDANMKDA